MPRPQKQWKSEEEKQLDLFGLGEVESKRKKEDETFLTTKPYVEIREEPNQPKELFSLRQSDFAELAREDYLLLGIDTEYQSDVYTQDDIKAGKGKYEVLSYQFYADDRTGANCSGIAIPDSHERLTLADFVVYALAKSVEQGVRSPDHNSHGRPLHARRHTCLWW